MIMNEWLELAGATLAGLLFGGFYFAGLWFTVNKGLKLRNPALLFIGSFLFRTAVAISGFYYVGAGSWQRILACTIGFILARYLVMQYTRKLSAKKSEQL